jgi:large subunit ribosomal protein L17
MHSRRLTRSSGARKALYRSLVTDLLGYEKITTTEAKAKAIRGVAEKMITLGKKGDLHARRQALSFIYGKKTTDKLFDELAKRYKGGYTRMVKLGARLGDGAPIVQLELVK